MQNYDDWYAKGYSVTPHKKNLAGLMGWTTCSRTPPDELQRKFVEKYKQEPEVWMLLGGKEIEGQKGKYSIIIDADAPGAFEALKARFPATRTHKGSKLGHFIFITDAPSPSFTYNLTDGSRAVDVLGVGKGAVLPPSPHRKTEKTYEIIDDVPPAFLPLVEIYRVLDKVSIERGWVKSKEKTDVGKESSQEVETVKKKVNLFDLGLKPGLQSCPLPGHKNGDEHPSLSVSQDGKLFNCFVHGGGDIFNWLMLRDSCDFKIAFHKLVEEHDVELGQKFNSITLRNLAVPTSHLKNFEHLDTITELFDDKYDLPKKALYYCLVGSVLGKKVLQVGTIRVDGRMNVAFAFPSGHGKKNLRETAKSIQGELGKSVAIPTSYHSEQFVGKTILRKKKKGDEQIVQIKGHLADDFVIVEEALDLIRHKTPIHEETSKYLRTALDVHGQNTVSKRLVDFERENTLEYTPHCSVMMFFQPAPGLPEEIVQNGLLRRFYVPYVPLLKIDSSAYQERLEGKDVLTRNSSMDAFVDYLKKLREFVSEKNFILTKDAKTRLIELHMELLATGQNHSNKGAKYTNIISFTLQDRLAQLSWINAVSDCRYEITAGDVERAFVDLTEFLVAELTFVQKKVKGSLDYGEGPNQEERKLISWLWEKNATAQGRSEVSIQDYIHKVSEITELTEESARKHYQKHKERGLICSKQTGQHESKVWLSQSALEGGKGDKGFLRFEYFKMLKKHFPAPENVTTLPPSEKKGQDRVSGSEADEGVLKRVKFLETVDKYRAGAEMELPKDEADELVNAGHCYYADE